MSIIPSLKPFQSSCFPNELTTTCHELVPQIQVKFSSYMQHVYRYMNGHRSAIYIYTQKLLAAEICSLPGRGRIASLSESLFPNRRHYFPFFSPPLVGPRSLLPRRSSKCILNGCRRVLPTLFFLQRCGKNILISSPESQESL